MKFIENSNEGVHCYNRFSADFSDNIVKLNNRDYPLRYRFWGITETSFSFIKE